MEFRSSAALRWRLLTGRSFSASAKRAEEMGVVDVDAMVMVQEILRLEG